MTIFLKECLTIFSMLPWISYVIIIVYKHSTKGALHKNVMKASQSS